MQKVNILAIGVHPDDVELSCSGTLLQHQTQGRTFGILDLTRGELGTRGSAEIRKRESARGAEILGAAFRVNLGMKDGLFQHTPENIKKIIAILRACRPDIVLINAIEDRHPDHGRAAKMTADACYYSGLAKIETTDEAGNNQERWRPQAVYHYIQDYNLTPDLVVDISDHWKKKLASIMAYSSQFFVPESSAYSKELSSPISGEDFLKFIESKARTYGRAAGFEYAEGFTVNRTIGVKNLFDLL